MTVDERPRILFVGSALTVGGAERHWSVLIPALAERFEVSLLTLVAEGPFFEELRAQEIPVVCAHMRHRADVAGFRRAWRLAAIRPDVLISQSINAHVVGRAIARRARAAHIANEHAGPGSPTRLHRRLLTRLVAPGVDAVIAVSASQLPVLQRAGYRSRSITVVPNGVPTPQPSRDADSTRRALGIPPDAFVAILVATLRPEKVAHHFVDAVQDAHRADPRIHGLVVGGGPELGRLQEATRRDQVVRVIGERMDVNDLLAAADVGCLSSSAEGIPMALLEAMALGLPVVSTDVGGVREAVVPEETGYLVSFGDVDAYAAALVRLASDPALAARLGEAGRERHRTLFGVERMIDDYARVITQLASRPRGTR